MKTIVKQIGAILLISGVVSVLVNAVHPRKIPWVQDWSGHVEAKARKSGLRVIPLSVALEKFQSLEPVFIDARSSDEFARGHIPNAVSIPFQSLEEQFPMIGSLIDSGRELIIYCKNRECDDALLLATELQTMGASNLVLYIDGFEAWQKYGGSTSSSTMQGEDTGLPSQITSLPQSIRLISPARVGKGNVFLIDVRSIAEFDQAHIPDAFSIHESYLSIASALESRSAAFIVYGGDIENIDALDYARNNLISGDCDIAILDGGFEAWRRYGGQVEDRRE